MTTTVPAGICAHLTCSPCAKAIEFYKRAFGATEVRLAAADDGQRLIHSELKVGPSTLFLCDDFPELCGGKSRTAAALGATPLVPHEYVPDVNAATRRAAEAGAEVTLKPEDQFWGDRYAQVKDPFGHVWSFGKPLKTS